MFINLSNHPASRWDVTQLEAAAKYGEVRDYPFPNVPATATEADIAAMADKIVADILSLDPDAVLCQGEMTLTYAIVSRLTKYGFPVVAACSERQVQETVTPSGETVKTAVFKFVGFRAY